MRTPLIGRNRLSLIKEVRVKLWSSFSEALNGVSCAADMVETMWRKPHREPIVLATGGLLLIWLTRSVGCSTNSPIPMPSTSLASPLLSRLPICGPRSFSPQTGGDTVAALCPRVIDCFDASPHMSPSNPFPHIPFSSQQ